ncbi:HD-GYP domain-containing protein [Poriferisphaera corsica]|nr:HD domain-containing phosphohydrolase [Poriferisphaera corsica]
MIQLIGLLSGLILLDLWLARQVTVAVQERIERNSNKLADELSKALVLLDFKDLSAGAKDREVLVDLIEGMDVAGVTYTVVYLLDSREMIGLNHEGMTRNQQREIRELAEQYATRLDMQYMQTDYVVAIRRMPVYDALLIVFQDELYLKGRIDLLTSTVKNVGMVVTIVIMSVAAFFTLLIFSRYEHDLDVINSSLEKKVNERTKALIRSRDAVIFGLAKLAESRDDETGQHLERICSYVKVLASDLMESDGKICGLDLEVFANTAALHDIGKVAVPDKILLKPGKLSKKEREQIMDHPGAGGDTLMMIKRKWGDDPFLITASQIAYAHHEKWDGTGYPFGLKEEEIPLAARIVAVADVYDALRTKRPYKDEMPHEVVVKYIVEQSGSHFDPRIVEIMVQHEKVFKIISETQHDYRE